MNTRKELGKVAALCATMGGLLCACGGDAGPAKGAGEASAGGASGGAPTTGSGGRSSAPSAGGTSVEDPSYSAGVCAGATPLAIPSEATACDGTVSCPGAAHCVPAGRVPGGIGKNVPACSNGKCVPDVLIRTGGHVSFKKCVSSYLMAQIPDAQADGVCIPYCFAILNSPSAVILPKGADGCGAEEVCAPCINPLTQAPTTACDDQCGL